MSVSCKEKTITYLDKLGLTVTTTFDVLELLI